ncbi:MAG: hypothetical protein Q8O67_23695 [Deltaproteobacteria bacterium]|nr:hypothetical protein [Deltaproteobacteria bacterium]
MSNARRVQELAINARKPRFALGATVVDMWNERGAVTAVYVDLDAAVDAGVVGKGWLAGLTKAPTTPATGHWYAVLCDSGGDVLAGELDLHPAPKRMAAQAEAKASRAVSAKAKARKR